MASIKIRTSPMELLEPEVTKPSPLRIIKRSKTVTGSSSSGETFRGGRHSSSCSSLESKGSPPSGGERPLTVKKKRQGDNFVDGFSADKSRHKENVQPIAPTSATNDDDDPDITPKAHQRVPRTISAGNFLRNEFHRRALEEPGRYSVRNNRTPFHPPPFTSHVPTSPSSAKDKPHPLAERKPSKSKSFILRALAGRSSQESKPEKRVSSKGSRNPLVRRLSRNKNVDSMPSRRTSMSENTLYSIHLNDLDFGDASRSPAIRRPLPQPPTLPYEHNPAPVEVPKQNMLILSPRIKVTPQVTSLPTTTCTIWVAIEIKGELHAADGRYDMHPSRRRCSSELLDIQLRDLSRYGSLFDMRVKVQPPRGCALLDYIGDLTFKLNALETRFILAKIRVGGVDSHPSPPTQDPEILMAEIQNHLGETLTHYLTVQATYKHSGFTEWEGSSATREGTYAHSSFHQTEARVAIKRHDTSSAWSPRNSATLNGPPSNIFHELIERHLPAEKATQAFEIIRKDQPLRLSTKRRASGRVAPVRARGAISRNALATSSTPQTPMSNKNSGPVVLPPSPVRQALPDEEDEEENDPARKIWASMRQASTGGQPRRHPRKSISADHYSNAMSEADSPERLSSSLSLTDSPHDQSFDSLDDSGIELERSKIKQVALKNKRSVGTETLRSMAPSVAKAANDRQATSFARHPNAGLGIRAGVWGWSNFWG